MRKTFMRKIWRFFNKYLLDTIVIFQTLTKWRSHLNSSSEYFFWADFPNSESALENDHCCINLTNRMSIYRSEHLSLFKSHRKRFDSEIREEQDRQRFAEVPWPTWGSYPVWLSYRMLHTVCIRYAWFIHFTLVTVEVYFHRLGSPDNSMNRDIFGPAINWPANRLRYGSYYMEILIFFLNFPL